MSDSADFYAKAVQAASPASTEGGASGYFSPASAGLDPHIFDGMGFRPEVAAWIRHELWGELTKLGLKAPAAWTTIWVAGSGVSYQWDSDRGNGDLDVLLGVDMVDLTRANPDWSGFSEDQFASWLNGVLKSDLWPRTAHHQINGQVYEVTYYLNPAVGRDITAINPYAAYKLTRPAGWTVRPDPNPPQDFPQGWQDAADRDAAMAGEIVGRYDDVLQKANTISLTSPAWPNVFSAVGLAQRQAQALFDDIHTGRSNAFEPGGHGYRDWHNYRWQAAKQSGTINGLKGILEGRRAADDARDTELYGGPIAPADEALSRAAMVSRERPGMPR